MSSDLVLPDLPIGIDDPEVYRWMESAQLFLEAIEIGQGGGSGTEGSGGGGTLIGVIPGDQVPQNLTKPPDVENFTIFIGNTFLGLTWDIPPAGAQVSYTEIARNTVDNLATAELGRLSVGGFWYDNLGRGSIEYFYWARHVRDLGGRKIFGNWTTDSVSGQTFPELAELLALIEGELSELHLTQALTDRINLIDAVGTGVVDRINAEVSTRIAEITRVETQSQADDDAISAQIDTLVLASGGRVLRDDEPPNPNTDPLAPFSGSDRWIDTDDGNHPYVWDPSVGNTVTPPFNWVSNRDQEIQKNTALIATAQQAIVDLENNKAEASDVTTLSTTVGNNTATLQDTKTSVDGVLLEQFIKTDIHGRVSGYGLSATPQSSAFIVAADRFVVSLPGFVDKPLFFVGPINGVNTIILNAQAFLGDASIENAAIDSLAAEKLFAITGTIAEAIIGNGHIQNAMIGNVIQSDTWNPATKAGWRILKNGLIEASGITIYDAAGNAIFGAGTGFSLNWARVGGAGRPENDATKGASWGENLNGIPYIQESFEQTQKWIKSSGPGFFSYNGHIDAQFGGRILRAQGFVQIDYTELIPFDPSATYVVRVRLRQFFNDRAAFIGVFGFGSDRQLRNRVGAVSNQDQYYMALNGVTLQVVDGYTVVEGYFSGYAPGAGIIGEATRGKPARFHSSVRYFRPVMILNAAAGDVSTVVHVDRFIVDKTEAQITDANISTFIDNAAINTLYLAGSAVTVVAVGKGGAQNGVGSFQPVASVSIDLNVPAPVLINWSFDQGFPAGPRNWGVRIRNLTTGVVLVDRIVTAVNDYPAGQTNDFVGPGTFTYELSWFGQDGSTILGNGAINVTASKR